MSGLVLRFTKSPHRTTQELLPWFVTGALGSEESDLIERHLHDCATCKAECDGLREVREAYPGRDPPIDFESWLDTMRIRLAEEAAQHARRRSGASPWAGGLRTGGSAWLKTALALQLGIILALGWSILARPERADYRTLASSAPATGDLIVEFNPDTSLREATRILQASGARVVEGPGLSNRCVLSIERDRLPVLLAALRAEPAVVRAEPLQTPGTP